MLTGAASEIKRKFPDLELLESEPMSRHCSFRIGGPADVLILPRTAAEIVSVCSLLRKLGESPLIIGNGTNLLFTDAPIRRAVIKLGDNFSGIEAVDGGVKAQSGVPLARLANFALDLGLTGLEFAHGIPGALGGAVVMNAGAYGGEMSGVVWSTAFLDDGMEFREVSGQEHEFAYRHSLFSDNGGVILGSALKLEAGEPEAIRELMRELSVRRRESQPLDMPSAGSTFKRPKTGYAAQMIDEAGLKGFRIGGAQVSEKHAGFIVNTGGASFGDVMRVIEYVQKTVFSAFSVELELEVKVIDK